RSSFAGATASSGSAGLRLFGGIAVQEIRLCRRDDLDKTDFLYVPAAVLYHDKEHLLKGQLSIRKVEITRPRLRAVRRHDGTWNLDGLLKPADPTQPMPTVVVRQGTLVVEDRLAAAGTPPLEVRNLSLTLVNDPLPTVSFEGSGECDAAGTVRVRGRLQRGGAAT